MKVKFVQDYPKISKGYCFMEGLARQVFKLSMEMGIVCAVSKIAGNEFYDSLVNGLQYGVVRNLFDAFDGVFFRKGRLYGMSENIRHRFQRIDEYGKCRPEGEGSDLKMKM